MSKRLVLGSFIAAASIVLSVQTANAGCAEEIKEAEKARTHSVGITDNGAAAFDRIMAKARAALAEKKERRCLKLVARARSKV